MLSLFFFILRLKGDKTVEEYKSNSHKSKENKKVEKIVSGSVKSRKKSEIQKFANVFIQEDAQKVKSYILLKTWHDGKDR